ncbi:MAG: glycosyltransferase family 4 protein [bacterium]|nr:glycosyltransferase family 4 protein [bacterium]
MKLCYVLPEYDQSANTHFAYLTDFIKLIAKSEDVFLIIEKGQKPKEDWGCKNVQKLWFSFLPFRWCEMQWRLLYARFNGCSIFYIHYSFLAAMAASLTTLFYGGRIYYWNAGLPWKYKKSFWREWFENSTYRWIDFLVTGTEGLKREYAKHYDLPLDKIKVMPNWINLDGLKDKYRIGDSEELKQRLNIMPEQKVVLFIHRLSKRKGAHYLPEILKGLQDDNVVMVIVGDGPEGKAIKSQITSYNLQDMVRFVGLVPNAEIMQYFAMADVFIMPSEEEGFPHVLLESMAMGIPFVAFDVGGVKEMTPPEFKEYILSPGDVDGFIDKSRALLIHAGEKDVGMRWVQRFDINNVVELFNGMVKD